MLKLLCYGLRQVGDEAEVMYFAAKMVTERDELIKVFRTGISSCSFVVAGAYEACMEKAD